MSSSFTIKKIYEKSKFCYSRGITVQVPECRAVIIWNIICIHSKFLQSLSGPGQKIRFKKPFKKIVKLSSLACTWKFLSLRVGGLEFLFCFTWNIPLQDQTRYRWQISCRSCLAPGASLCWRQQRWDRPSWGPPEPGGSAHPCTYLEMLGNLTKSVNFYKKKLERAIYSAYHLSFSRIFACRDWLTCRRQPCPTLSWWSQAPRCHRMLPTLCWWPCAPVKKVLQCYIISFKWIFSERKYS